MTYRILRAAGVAGIAATLLLFLNVSPAAADSIGTGISEFGDDVVGSEISLNILWIILGAVLVIFMQAGFALVETGFCRAKHAAHVVMTNFAIFGIGFVAFFLVGYAFMFGGYSYVLEGADFGYNQAIGEPLIKVGDWVFLWKGGFALSNI